MRLFLWFSTNVSLLGFVSSIVTIIRKPVGHENECSSRKERSISFTVMASFFGTTATVCKWTVEAVLWLLLCFFFTVGPSDWIALLFYMTQREKQYDRCCWGCIMDYGQSKNNNWFHMHSSCSHAISYITSVDQNTKKIRSHFEIANESSYVDENMYFTPKNCFFLPVLWTANLKMAF